jgi:PAS domain S-box-containing protein
MSSGFDSSPVGFPKTADESPAEQFAFAKRRIEALESELRKLKYGNQQAIESFGMLTREQAIAAKIHEFVNRCPYPACVVDKAFVLDHFNKAFVEMLQGRIDVNGPRYPIGAIFPETFCDVVQKIAAGMEAGAGPQTLYWEHRKGGQRIHYKVSVNPMGEEEVDGYGLWFVDVTPENRHIEHLELRESRLSKLVEKTDSIVVQIDPRFHLDYVNPAGQRCFGLEPRFCRGIPLLDLIHVEDADKLERSFHEEIAKQGYQIVQETRLPSKSDSLRTILWSFQLEYSATGELLHINGIGRDISRRRELEQQLLRAKETAESADQSKSEFLAMISHEIRTPLNSIIGLSDLLHDSKLPEEEKTMVGTISTAGASLLALINDVLDLSKVEAGHIALSNMEFEIHECVNQIRQLYDIRAKTADIKFECRVDPDVPPVIHIDRDRLMQILNNLLSNAMKFTSKGKVVLSVSAEPLVNLEEFDLWKDEGEAYKPYRYFFSVEDTGIGISPEQRVLLFQPFSQADPSIRRRFGGTGLGLVICRKLAHLMEGDIELESELGKGSKFTVHLKADGKWAQPTQNLSTPSELLAKRSRKVDRSLAERFPMRIMVVDDVAHNRLVMQTLLKRMGYSPFMFACAEHALDFLDSGSEIDLIFMDMLMPEMSGTEAVREIRAREMEQNQTKRHIVALTANATQHDREECEASGMDGFISKPIRFSMIQDAIMAAKKGL